MKCRGEELTRVSSGSAGLLWMGRGDGKEATRKGIGERHFTWSGKGVRLE